MVVHLTRWAADPDGTNPDRTDPDVFGADSMAAGITLATWFKGEARRAYALLGESDAERDERRLVEWVGRKGTAVTARQVQQGCRWLKQPGEAEAALNGLIKAGRGHWRELPTTAAGGRPSRTFELSAPSTAHETPSTDDDRGGSVDVDSVDAGAAASDAGTDFPFGRNNPGDPDGDRLFPDLSKLPD